MDASKVNSSLTINEGNASAGRTAITAAAQGFMTAFPDWEDPCVEF